MNKVKIRQTFDAHQLQTAYQSVTMSEELVSNYYKMSANQWLRPKYDVKTLSDLSESEIIDGPFAQIIRYEGQRPGSSLGSESYDLYKICLQDHTILQAIEQNLVLSLLPFSLYIISHELIHIVRFSRFLQNFNASADEKMIEERRVHQITHEILSLIKLSGLSQTLEYFKQWRQPMESLSDL